MDAIEIISGEVREAIRSRGIDPRTEPESARRLVSEAIADYDERTLAGRLPVLADPAEALRSIVDEIAGFGPLQRYLDDPEVEEVWLNSPQAVFISRRGISELTTTMLTNGEVDDLIERMLRTSGRRVDLSSPFVDAMLPDGSRLHVVLPDITRAHPAINIRKFIARTRNLGDLVAANSLTGRAAEFLDAAVAAGANIVVSGATQAGKTTMLNALTGSIPARERVVTCEEVFELAVPARDWVAMQVRQPSLEGTGEVTLRQLVKEALRMRPSRIIVGEVREAESFDLLVAMNSGLPGMGSIHANSARSAVTKLCTLPLLAGPNIGSSFVTPTVASSVDLVVHLVLERDGSRRVEEIVAVPGGIEGDVVELETVFTRDAQRRLVRGTGFTHLGDRLAAAGHDVRRLLSAS
ncbi:ATPase, T2SS/T4P/T4SS family [Brevibacterium sp. BRM-1]|uniref:CpaF family protein n=1 Tax=Brevibacterium sp. BRM-1 TaxID=2999062 RepID=UPI002281D2D1|nr:ATPase, T2SS/T4P/T4SS family [Brevibacterium sp. BRM-1]WAL40218.1 ATPase, T2SS/T4P/T4SS family [Brevibacterium sp. BRM-1]